eukprot:CAMPEP_0170144294 /NCGR_PEP_ID=MMETSP0033_2-20121228/13404_1 /TAXON_ID=195969 /ORGANISM="Dolichomastix tenuilepis, Strain CCMP3274" /LENGTH=219 /DNA_ID=CAMNT_0010380785 /DNA_START=65 /DNA_END=724 /DNA_ORIENTATION=-
MTSMWSGFKESLIMILSAEVGDKTFFIAAIMAMRHSRGLVLSGALGALWIMTLMSAVFGSVAPRLISRTITHWIATGMFFFFGLRSLYDSVIAWKDDGESELAEVEAELSGDLSKSPKLKRQMGIGRYLPPVFLEAFTLTFVAEWGDRSQLATIGLAAKGAVVGVTVGGCIGHSVCTGMAVLGGRYLANTISERMVQICGGTLFVLFGLHFAYSGPDLS